mgnify:CR=1 FL=1
MVLLICSQLYSVIRGVRGKQQQRAGQERLYQVINNAGVGCAEEPRMLGLAMVPGHHIVKLYIDQYSLPNRSQPNRTSPTSDSDS